MNLKGDKVLVGADIEYWGPAIIEEILILLC